MGSTHGIGVKRNDYRRPNKRENKGHRWRGGGGNVGDSYERLFREHIRIVKRHERLTAQHVEELNAREEAKPEPSSDVREEDELAYFHDAMSSLAMSRLLYIPPFLKPNEIRERRFGNPETMNDKWWEWEEELGRKSTNGRPRRK